ncbi:MAG: hypothetical protein GDA39_08250 [Hyphomonadaceae bacterium]|nr:hypothetical protein [Hyphomonadaceae bacterium]MBC6412851.1 hypothetical protein [Hyphomonadaceae bacterium]
MKLLLAFSLSACATADDAPPSQSSVPSSQSSAPSVSSRQPGQLGPRELASGQCGLFVWTGDARRRFILFSDSQRSQAALATASGEIPLQITSETGSDAYFQYPVTSYRTETGETVNLALGDYRDTTSGRSYRSGTLKTTRGDGWEQVTPVIGLAVCQPPA